MPRKTVEQEVQEKDLEITRLMEENKALRDGIVELKNLNSEQPQDDGPDRDDGLTGLAAYFWSRPEGRVTLLAVVIYLRMVAYRYDESIWRNNIVCGLAAFYLFCKWNEQEYRFNGFILLLMKWALFGGGLYLTWLTFFGMVTEPLQASAFVLVLVLLLTISKLMLRIAERAVEIFDRVMQLPVFAWAKGWLA